jgi:hypothetical protein
MFKIEMVSGRIIDAGQSVPQSAIEKRYDCRQCPPAASRRLSHARGRGGLGSKVMSRDPEEERFARGDSERLDFGIRDRCSFSRSCNCHSFLPAKILAQAGAPAPFSVNFER